MDLVHRTVRSCGVVRSKSEVTMNISNNGSSLALLCTVGLLRRFCPGEFRLSTVAYGMKFRKVSFANMTRFYGRLRVPCRRISARVTQVMFRRGGSAEPYSLYTGLQGKTVCRQLKRLKVGGVTCTRGGSSFVRATLVSLVCRNQFCTFPPIARLPRTKIAIVHPVVCIPRRNMTRFITSRKVHIIGGAYPMSNSAGETCTGGLVRRVGERAPKTGSEVVRTVIGKEFPS